MDVIHHRFRLVVADSPGAAIAESQVGIFTVKEEVFIKESGFFNEFFSESGGTAVRVEALSRFPVFGSEFFSAASAPVQAVRVKEMTAGFVHYFRPVPVDDERGDHIHLGIFQWFDQFFQKIFRNDGVVVEDDDDISVCHIKSPVVGNAEAEVSVQQNRYNERIGTAGNPFSGAVGGAVVRDNDFKIRKGLF